MNSGIFSDRTDHPSPVGRAEQVQMVQQVVEVVQIPSFRITGFKGPTAVVSLMETRGETAEEFRHGNVSLPMPIVNRRVDQPSPAVGSGHPVSSPQIPMEQAGTSFIRFGKEILQTIQNRLHRFPCSTVTVSSLTGQIPLKPQPLFSEELMPGFHHPVILNC